MLLLFRLILCAVKSFYMGKDFKGDPPLYMKVAAGLTTGALAIAVASPTDLVKASRQPNQTCWNSVRQPKPPLEYCCKFPTLQAEVAQRLAHMMQWMQ